MPRERLVRLAFRLELLPRRPWLAVVEQRQDHVAPRRDPAPGPREPRVRLREALHVERLPVASQGVGGYGVVRPHGQAVVALESPRQVLCQPAVVAVAPAVALGVCGVGVSDLARQVSLGDPLLPSGEAGPLEPEGGDGLDRHRAEPLELLRELASPVGLEAAAFPFVPGFPRGGGVVDWIQGLYPMSN